MGIYIVSGEGATATAQLGFGIPNWIANQTNLSWSAKRLLTVIGWFVETDGRYYGGRVRFSEILCETPQSVAQAYCELFNQGYLKQSGDSNHFFMRHWREKGVSQWTAA